MGSGSPVRVWGRPPKELDPEILKLEAQDSVERNAIEGKFGQCKRRLGLGRVMTRLKGASETAIAMTILTANLIKLLDDGLASSRIPAGTVSFKLLTALPVMPESSAFLDMAA